MIYATIHELLESGMEDDIILNMEGLRRAIASGRRSDNTSEFLSLSFHKHLFDTGRHYDDVHYDEIDIASVPV